MLLAIVVFFVSKSAHTQDLPKELYKANGIPDSLKDGANSVVRYSSDEVTVTGPGKLTLKHHSLVTILNEKGDRQAEVVLFYNKKFVTYSDIDIRAYDAGGVLLKKYHKSDMVDEAVVSDEILLQDDRLLGLKHTVANYPATIEVSYEEDVSGFVNLEQWDIQDDQQSIQKATYKISIIPNMGFRYKCKNINLEPSKETINGVENYTWQISNKKSFKIEEGSVKWRVLPKIEFGVAKFEYYGYPGDFSSWKSFGEWQQKLNADVSDLSPQRVAEIQQMTANIKTDKEKAKFLYEYMQKDMRYVAIALGIGGLKPFPAMFVDQKKYGDCKAFSNYMVALLKAVNIKAYYAIIEAGNNGEPSDTDFPYDISDHIICCIPFKNDTTWLECTSSTQPFGVLGPFTENRNALIITEEGGKLVNTPKSKADENQFNSEVHIAIDTDGSAKAQVKIVGTGEYRRLYIDLSMAKEQEQKQYLMHSLNIRQPSVFEIQYGKQGEADKELDLNLEYDKFCDIAVSNKQFYHPHVFDLCAFTVPVEEKRTSDYYYDFPLEKSCVTTIDLPAGYEIETLPSAQNLRFSYGDCEITYVYNAAKNEVISTEKFNINNHVIPAAKYTEMQQYLDAVAKAQNKKLVIRRKA
jgi:transglutaminase-like putative cysteine protease